MNAQHHELETWLYQTIGLEMFRGGFERAQKTFAPYKKLFLERGLQIITIAGTNGKGQTAFECERHLLDQGIKTALWTSPHILRVTERFRFQGTELDAGTLLAMAQNLYQQGHTDLSYYEFLFLCFCQAVKEDQSINVLVLEVGMGGLLDAVNVFDADIVGLTSISLDHTTVLGSSVEQICEQKWGVTRFGKVVVSALEQEELHQLTRKWASEQEIELIEISLMNYPHYDERNQATAARIVARFLNKDHEFLSLLERAKARTLMSPGRFEEMTLGSLRFIFIGAHNSDGYQKMAQVLERKAREGLVFDTVFFSFSTRPQEEFRSLVSEVKKSKFLARSWWFSPFDHPKAMTEQEMKDEIVQDLFSALKVHQWEGVDQAIAQLKDNNNQTILVTGSYYFIGEVQKCISRSCVDYRSGDSQSCS
jgi:dihydrofolate synthase / folylpolyglutamate synthase